MYPELLWLRSSGFELPAFRFRLAGYVLPPDVLKPGA